MERHAGNAHRVRRPPHHHLSTVRTLRDPRKGEGGTHHLLRSHANRLDGKLAPAHIEQVLKIRAKEVDDKDIVETLLAEVVYLGDASYIKA